MTDTVRQTIAAPESADFSLVVGPEDRNLRLVEELLGVQVCAHGTTVEVAGGEIEVQTACTLLGDLMRQAAGGTPPDEDGIRRSVDLLRTSELSPAQLRDDVIVAHRGRVVRPKTAGQKRYVDAIRANAVTFGIGPAGTGKTYLAMAMALAALQSRQVARVVLSRPVVEAGESLGYLPGSLFEKIDPYLRPLFDALYDMMDRTQANALLSDGTIEVAPLAFMRGRTLNDAFIILDEAQNATPEQLKMFLTRLGTGSKMVVTGDITQLDLPRGRSGLALVRPILQDVDGIAFCTFEGHDVVRHSLVARIVRAYERAERERRREEPARGDAGGEGGATWK